MAERPELAALRNARGYTQDELGAEIGVTGLTISRYERGVSTPQGKAKRRYARTLNISMAKLNALLNGADSETDLTDDEDEDDDEQLLAPKWFSIYVAVEQAATSIDSYQPHFIHGLLQTEEYARTLIEREQRHYEQVERLVRLRMSRQPALLRDSSPLRLTVVLSEAAVRLQVGNSALMRRQLAHLLGLAQRENVIVRLLPFAAGSHSADRGAFTLTTPPWEQAPNVVYFETYPNGATYIEESNDIKRFSDLFVRLRSMSLPADQSIDKIKELEEELYK